MNKYSLKQCVWEITLACCFSCKYCGSAGGRARDNELSTAECLSVAEQLKDLGCKRVSMIGGEVFMRRDWREIVGALTEKDIAVNIITNGFLFSENLIDDLKRLRVESISVSLDGPEAVHDRYRQEGSYKRALKAIDALCRNHFPVSVISTLNQDNVSGLEALYQTLCAFPIYAWQLQACSPMGNAAQYGVNYAFDFNLAIDFVESRMRQAPFAMGIADNIGYFTPGEGSLRGNMSGRAVYTGCSAGLSSIGIDSIGNVRGCESMYDDFFNEGNLRERSLREIWDDENAFAYNRKFDPSMLTGRCRTCEKGPYCAGGCRSYNYFVHKKLYESPHCARNTKTSGEISSGEALPLSSVSDVSRDRDFPDKSVKKEKVFYHLPGLFEFYELYREFLPLFYEHREYFYDWCEISSIYGAPADCLWGGGRAGFGSHDPKEVLALMEHYGISSRLTFSNSLLTADHLRDKRCNDLCAMFAASKKTQNGVIVHSDLLADYLKKTWPSLYLVSSTTKVLTDFNDFRAEVQRDDFLYVVPDFRLNKAFDKLIGLTKGQKDKVEFLCNECCSFACKDRKLCYENVSRKNLGENCPDHQCTSPNAEGGYRFSKAMENPGFISLEDIKKTYLPMGFTNFKIEGRSLGSALILEFLLYYMTKPEYQIHVREAIYLDNSLDLF